MRPCGQALSSLTGVPVRRGHLERQNDTRDVREQRLHEKAAEGGNPQAQERGLRSLPYLHLILGFPPPELCKNKSLLFKSLHLWYFIMAALANEYCP